MVDPPQSAEILGMGSGLSKPEQDLERLFVAQT